MTAKHQPDPVALETIKLAVATLDELSPPDLVQALIWISQRYRADAQRLKEEWRNPNTGEPDVEAGKVWDIAAEGLEKTAEAVQKHWDNL